MNISFTVNRIYLEAKQNRWLRYFALLNRAALAAGFLAAGMVKIMGERFASGLSVNHPMGHYLEALYHTGYYYTFIGVMQILAAVLLLIPRTVTLGALLYLPIILNICILSFAVRFEGSIFTSPLMVLADLFLLCWNYDKLKYILPFNHVRVSNAISSKEKLSNRFPTKFFLGVFAIIIILIVAIRSAFGVMPRNNIKDCNAQFQGTNRTKAGCDFCNCIHQQGKSLDSCLAKYHQAADDSITAK